MSKIKVMKKLFNQCSKNPKCPDEIKLQPINKKPCLWWRGKKVIEDEDAKGFIMKNS